ncbi:hypothetical protein M5K25_000236 [Dendrobium thyrsiflorum]|uniref:Uncharacterized protein n=1 Tax=Dendrobium thyrsiflorum TaxID=117978 RepID=A0ABD0VT39_DENTH
MERSPHITSIKTQEFRKNFRERNLKHQSIALMRALLAVLLSLLIIAVLQIFCSMCVEPTSGH